MRMALVACGISDNNVAIDGHNHRPVREFMSSCGFTGISDLYYLTDKDCANLVKAHNKNWNSNANERRMKVTGMHRRNYSCFVFM